MDYHIKQKKVCIEPIYICKNSQRKTGPEFETEQGKMDRRGRKELKGKMMKIYYN